MTDFSGRPVFGEIRRERTCISPKMAPCRRIRHIQHKQERRAGQVPASEMEKLNEHALRYLVFVKRPSMAEASQIAGFACCSDARKFVKENEYTFLAVRSKDGLLVRSRLA